MNADLKIVGNVTDSPELRFTQGGKAVCNFSVAVNKRIGQGDDARDEATFYRVTAWESLAENASATLAKGTRVMVWGDVHNKPYKDKDGNARLILEVKADFIGVELRWATAVVTKADNAKSGNSGGQTRNAPVQDDEEPF